MSNSHSCQACGAAISNCYPRFGICTPCAIAESERVCAIWREQQRREAYARFETLKTLKAAEAIGLAARGLA